MVVMSNRESSLCEVLAAINEESLVFHALGKNVFISWD